jgi:hypothetical protein
MTSFHYIHWKERSRGLRTGSLIGPPRLLLWTLLSCSFFLKAGAAPAFSRRTATTARGPALVVPSVGGFGACLWFAYAVRALGDRGGGNAGNVPRASECFNCCLANGRDRPHVPRASTNQCNSRRRQGGEAPISSLFAVRMIAYFGSYRSIGSAAKLLSLQNYISGRI